MKFSKMMKKYEKAILLTIAILICASLVVWIPTVPTAGDNGDAGYFFLGGEEGEQKKITVSSNKFSEIASRSFYHMFLRCTMPFITEKYGLGELPIFSPQILNLLRHKSFTSGRVFKGNLLLTDDTKRYWDAMSNDTNQRIYLQFFKGDSEVFPQTPTFDELRSKVSWENIILLELAKRLNVSYTQEEFETAIKEFVITWSNLDPRSQQRSIPFYTKQSYLELLKRFFGPETYENPGPFEQSLKEYLIISKLLNKLTETTYPSIREVFEEQTVETSKKIAYAIVQPKHVMHLIQPINEQKIIAYYNRNKEKFTTQTRGQLYYLSLTYGDNLTAVEKPSDEEAEKYFEKNKSEFKEGEAQKEFEEVKEKAIKLAWIERLKKDKDFIKTGFDFVRSIKQKLDSMEYVKNMHDIKIKLLKEEENKEALEKEHNSIFQQFYPAFDSLADDVIKEFESKGIKITRDITTMFTNKEAEELKESTFGTDSSISSFTFSPERLPGDIHKYNSDELPYERTENGFFIYMLIKKEEPQQIFLNNRIKELIRGVLTREQVDILTEKLTREITDKLNELDNYYEITDYYPQIEIKASGYLSRDNISKLPSYLRSNMSSLLSKLDDIGEAKYHTFTFKGYTFYVVATLLDYVKIPDDFDEMDFKRNRNFLIEKKRIIEKARMKDTIIKTSSLTSLGGA